jgi:flagellar biosynthesis protein FlhB
MPDKGTEQATPQRKKKARDRGDGVHSRELLSAMSMLGGVIMLGVLSKGFVSSFANVYIESLRSAAAVGGVNGQSGERLFLSAVGRVLLLGRWSPGWHRAAACRFIQKL